MDFYCEPKSSGGYGDYFFWEGKPSILPGSAFGGRLSVLGVVRCQQNSVLGDDFLLKLSPGSWKPCRNLRAVGALQLLGSIQYW